MILKPKGVGFKLFVVTVFLTASSVLFAYDGEIYGGYDGHFSRYQFIQQASDITLAENVLRGGAGELAQIDTLFQITEDDVDEEDVQMLNDLVKFISQEYELADGDAYSYMVKRGQTDISVDGWIVFSHLNAKGWFHYIYYFAMSR